MTEESHRNNPFLTKEKNLKVRKTYCPRNNRTAKALFPVDL